MISYLIGNNCTFLTYLLDHCEWQKWLTDTLGDTPLHVVCNKTYSQSSGKVLSILLDRGFDPTVRNKRNRLPEEALTNKDKRRKLISSHLKRMKEKSVQAKKETKKDAGSELGKRERSAGQSSGSSEKSVSDTRMDQEPASVLPSSSKQAAKREKQTLKDQLSRLLNDLSTSGSHLEWVLERKRQEKAKLPNPSRHSSQSSDHATADSLPDLQQNSYSVTALNDRSDTVANANSAYDAGLRRTELIVPPGDVGEELSCCLWEVRCTSDVWKVLHNKKKNRGMAKSIVSKIRMLANGEWRHDLCREIKGTPAGLVLFEANVSQDVRIIWERAKAFSPRLSEVAQDKELSSTDARRHVYTEVIRVWDIVFKHDQLSQRTEKIVQCHKKGEAAVNIRLLEGLSDEYLEAFKSGTKHEQLPKKYLLKSEESDTVRQVESLVPPANPQEKDYNIVKFYPVTESMVISAVETEEASDIDFCFDVNPEEWEIIHRSSTSSILLLGRSGTGKTTCCLYRMWVGFKNYWKPTTPDRPWWRPLTYTLDIEDESQQPMHMNDRETTNSHPVTGATSVASTIVRNHAQSGDETVEVADKYEDLLADLERIPCKILLPKGRRYAAGLETGNHICDVSNQEKRNVTKAPRLKSTVDEGVGTESLCSEDRTDITQFVHVQQIFVTKNGVLCDRMRKNFLNLCHGDTVSRHHRAYENEILPYRLQDIHPLQFPLFLTSRQWLLILDGSLPQPFFERLEDGALKCKVSTWGDIDSLLDTVPLIEEDASDDEDGRNSDAEDELGDINRLLTESVSATRGTEQAITEVTYSYFEACMWRDVKKASQDKEKCTYHPSLVWTEIKSFIKGSLEALHTETGHLSLEEYCRLGRKQAPNFDGNRVEVYSMFTRYERLKRSRGAYDECDLVFDLYRRLATRQNLGWAINQLYVDETQDFTQAEIALFLRCCQDPNALFLTGDTAQGIMRGVSFRFKDIRSLFYHASQANPGYGKINVPDMQDLRENYRSHTGILELANGVVVLMEHFFPESFDILPKDQGIFPGPKPSLLMVTEYDELALMLRGNRRRSSPIEFGARQVILVRSDEVINEMPEELTVGLVMTIFEAKGLEFDDVLLYNFFTDSKVFYTVTLRLPYPLYTCYCVGS